MIYVCGPGHGGARHRRQLPGSKAPTARSTRTSARTRRDAQAVPPVLLPRRHPEPRRARDAGLDPRGRRARLRAVARLRRGVRQSRPHRRLRGRRRRGGDRAAGDVLALQQVPQSRDATARCCRSCTSTATRSPTPPSSPASATRSCRSCSAATATRPISSRATSRRRCTQLMAATLDDVLDRNPRRSRGARSPVARERPRWPMIMLRSPRAGPARNTSTG